MVNKCFVARIGYTNGLVTDMCNLGFLSENITLKEANEVIHPDKIDIKQFKELMKGDIILPKHQILTYDFNGFMYKFFSL